MTVAYNTAVALSIPCLFQNKLVFKCYSFLEGLVRHTLCSENLNRKIRILKAVIKVAVI